MHNKKDFRLYYCIRSPILKEIFTNFKEKNQPKMLITPNISMIRERKIAIHPETFRSLNK